MAKFEKSTPESERSDIVSRRDLFKKLFRPSKAETPTPESKESAVESRFSRRSFNKAAALLVGSAAVGSVTKGCQTYMLSNDENEDADAGADDDWPDGGGPGEGGDTDEGDVDLDGQSCTPEGSRWSPDGQCYCAPEGSCQGPGNSCQEPCSRDEDGICRPPYKWECF